jgi:hypothetical protein
VSHAARHGVLALGRAYEHRIGAAAHGATHSTAIGRQPLPAAQSLAPGAVPFVLPFRCLPRGNGCSKGKPASRGSRCPYRLESVLIGDEYPVVPIEVVNKTDRTICYRLVSPTASGQRVRTSWPPTRSPVRSSRPRSRSRQSRTTSGRPTATTKRGVAKKRVTSRKPTGQSSVRYGRELAPEGANAAIERRGCGRRPR